MSRTRKKHWYAGEFGLAPYAERKEEDSHWLDRALAERYGIVASRLGGGPGSLRRRLALIEREAHGLADTTDAALRDRIEELRQKIVRTGLREVLIARAFALIREVAAREIGLRHYPVQLMGGWALLEGRLVEMETGEGKTLTAALPAVAAALAGVPVHVITVNDYLASRDADILAPVYRKFGLSVGVTEQEQDPRARQRAYAADVVHCTNKDVVFDYLRDRLAVGRRRGDTRVLIDRTFDAASRSAQPLLRGLHFAIVDEADSVLIDEARTPLIISGKEGGPEANTIYSQALHIARRLVAGHDFRIDKVERVAELTSQGEASVRALAADLPGVFASRRAREEILTQALTALHLFERDTHYIIDDDGKVQIVDEYTGRVMPDRTWERGLHQLIEEKEGCAVTGRRGTQARITYQRFFRRYLRLAGMSGTVSEVAGEMWAVYGLRTTRIPTNRPLQRRYLGTKMYGSSAAKWDAVALAVRDMSERLRRPVLVGTHSVAASEALSRVLSAQRLPHVVLNARQDKAEADIVARAGEPGRITVATNMAGRGTDIKISRDVADAGGLHVILTEFHESSRIDRQLFGRSGRQGDPGSCEAIVSVEDEIFRRFGGHLSKGVSVAARRPSLGLGAVASKVMRVATQRRAERVFSKARKETVRLDRELDRALAIAGLSE